MVTGLFVCVKRLIYIVIGITVFIIAGLAAVWAISSDYKLYGVPVFNYHQVNDTGRSPLTMPVDEFDRQMAYLYENGYHTITLDELYEYITHDMPLPDRPVVITFDDGYTDNLKYAMPILEKYHMNAVLFMIGDAVDTDRFLSSAELDTMAHHGFDIEGHTNHHHVLTAVDESALPDELRGGKIRLEDILNKRVSYLAYPGGYQNKTVRDMTREAGYKMAFTVQPGTVKPGDDPYALHRLAVFEGNTAYLSFLLRLHCAPCIRGTWALRDYFVSHGWIVASHMIPLF